MNDQDVDFEAALFDEDLKLMYLLVRS